MLEVKLINILDQVEAILKEYPDARNSDWILNYRYYKKYYGTTDPLKLKDLKAPPTKSIERSRRTLQKRHEYMSDKQIKKYRDKQEAAYKFVYS